jgi:uncharacterized protein with PIN domain
MIRFVLGAITGLVCYLVGLAHGGIFMERLTDKDTAEELEKNMNGLAEKGVEPSVNDRRYIKLARFENDVENSVETVETVNTAKKPHTFRFICDNCGVCLEDWKRPIIEEAEDGTVEQSYLEYEFKYCPQCGAKIIGGNTNE